MLDIGALQTLHQQDAAQLRLSGSILRALVRRGILTDSDARGILQDIVEELPPGTDDFRQGLTQLHDQFPQG